MGVTPEILDRMYAERIADVILVEADGAAHKPVKAPNQTEPVIPDCTSLCIGVVGLDCLTQTLTEEHVHRHILFSKLTGCKVGEEITPLHLQTLACSPDGLFKNCPAQCSRHVLFNKSDAVPKHTLSTLRTLCPPASTPFSWWAGSAHSRFIVPL